MGLLKLFQDLIFIYAEVITDFFHKKKNNIHGINPKILEIFFHKSTLINKLCFFVGRLIEQVKWIFCLEFDVILLEKYRLPIIEFGVDFISINRMVISSQSFHFRMYNLNCVHIFFITNVKTIHFRLIVNGVKTNIQT